MRDLLSKLDKIIAEETLQDLKKHPMAKDPAIAKAIADQEKKENPEETYDVSEDTRIGDPVYIKGCEWDDVIAWLEENVGPVIKKNANYKQGWRGRDWILYPTGRSDEDGIETLELSANTKFANKKALAKAIEDDCRGQSGSIPLRKEDIYQVGDDFGISFTEDFEIATEISDILEDGILIDLDEHAIELLQKEGITFVDVDLNEEKKKDEAGQSCWKGYRKVGTKPGTGRNKGKRVNDCEKIGEETELEEKSYPFAGRAVGHKEGPAGQWRNKGPKANKPAQTGDLVGGTESVEHDVDEAKYQGREVPLGKPMAGDVKKSKVYVRGPKGNVVKVNFGDKKMKIKKSNPKRRKSFRARHNCANPGPRWKARYWSCRAW